MSGNLCIAGCHMHACRDVVLMDDLLFFYSVINT